MDPNKEESNQLTNEQNVVGNINNNSGVSSDQVKTLNNDKAKTIDSLKPVIQGDTENKVNTPEPSGDTVNQIQNIETIEPQVTERKNTNIIFYSSLVFFIIAIVLVVLKFI